jgi:ubiquinone/menaquinone biosynthesis C-methylase UbiE
MTEPHSKQFLSDERDRWWSDAQIRAIAGRLGEVSSAIDVGCGQGHWTRVIASAFPEASILGIDREPEWIRIACERDARIRYEVGTAERLPAADATVDLVTAQTLLIHVADPRAVLAEMARVLAPGGRLWLNEPNNLANAVATFAQPTTDPDLVAEMVRFEQVCERGKHALGLGYNSLGESLVGLLDPATWRDVHVELCQRVHPVVPPYRPDLIDEVRRWLADPIATWPRDETQRYFTAGGGDAAGFERGWTASIALLRLRAQAILAGTYAGCEGTLFYAVTAAKR